MSIDGTSHKRVGYLSSFLSPSAYNDRNILPGGGANQVICKPGVNPAPGKVCIFDTSSFGPCSRENAYGYKSASPCVFLKLNRIFNWVPEFYNDPNDLPAEMPQSLKDHIAAATNKNQVWVSCQPEFPVDNEIRPKNISYYPSPGLSGEFYPYTNAPGYLSPLVAVQFTQPKREWIFLFALV